MLDWSRLCEIEDEIVRVEQECVTTCKKCIGKNMCILSKTDITEEELEQYETIDAVENKIIKTAKSISGDYDAGFYNGMAYVYNSLIKERYNECVKTDGKWGIRK